MNGNRREKGAEKAVWEEGKMWEKGPERAEWEEEEFKLGTTSLTPLKLYPLLQTPPNIQKLSLTSLELSKILTYSPPYKLRPKYPCFSFKKK
jgi:hypothetical protein